MGNGKFDHSNKSKLNSLCQIDFLDKIHSWFSIFIMSEAIPLLLKGITKEGSDTFFQAKQVVARLQNAGFTAYFAGGCVRDLILGIKPKDFDIATDASIEEIQQIFDKTILVGASFGVARVIENGYEFEIAQFRQEADYVDGRHPSKVSKSSPKQDAQRRDFTINALFYDPIATVLYDYVDGLKDLHAQKIRAVGDARARFKEDHLRILRALRFRSQLGFLWDSDLVLAMQSEAHLVSRVSRERIRDEYLKLRRGEHFQLVLKTLIEFKFLQILFPTLSFDVAAFLPALNLLDESAWWELGLWSMRSGSSYVSVVQELSSLRLSRSEQRSLVQFLSWFDVQSTWCNESVGSLVERSFSIGARDGLLLWLQLNKGSYPNEEKLWFTLRRFSLPPEPWVKAIDFPDLQGVELGKVLKLAYHQQLEDQESKDRNEFMNKFNKMARLRSED